MGMRQVERQHQSKYQGIVPEMVNQVVESQVLTVVAPDVFEPTAMDVFNEVR